MRALWSAASGMRAEQTSVDTISHNIANVNTMGYKEQTTQFKTLLYQTLQAETTTANGETKPTAAQVGLGTRIASINSSYTQGAQLDSDNPMALCINGNGFFSVQAMDGTTLYTRDGNFSWMTTEDPDTLVLANPNGNMVLDTEGKVITCPAGSGENVSVSREGEVGYLTEDGKYVETGQQIALYQFPNPVGLEKVSGNLLQETEASGEAINEATTDRQIIFSTMSQGYLEGSNVNMADEMVELIISQRAYEMNSKAIQTSDSMLQTANQLKQ